MATNFEQASVLKHQNTVGHPNSAEPVRDNYRRATFSKLRKSLKHLVLGAGIESRRWFIENDLLGIAHVRPTQRNLLPLPTRQFDTLAKRPTELLIITAR